MSSEPINLIDFSWNKSNTVVESNLKKNSYLKILLFGSLIVNTGYA